MLLAGSATIFATGAGDTSLSPLDLDASRGNNQGNALNSLTCIQLSGIPACQKLGQGCATCAVYGYTVVIGAGAGYNKGVGVGQCGQNWIGLCNNNANNQLYCDQLVNMNKACVPPPSSPTVQP